MTSKCFVRNFIKINDKLEIRRNAKRVPVEGITTHADIPYLSGGNEYHLLDVYCPKQQEGSLPIIFDVHGGGWIYGKKEINKQYCSVIASKGYCVVNISYRLITEDAGGTFPACLEDIFAALKWTKENIASYGGDLNNFFITGDSAGAHLTSLVLSVLADEKMQERLNLSADIDIKAAALTCGVADIESFLKIKLPVIKHLGKLFLGNDYKTSEFRPFLTIKNNNVEKFPPIFFDTCDGDFVKRDVLKFYEECTSRGLETQLNYVKKCDQKNTLTHVYAVLFPHYENSQNTIDNMLAFFKRHMVQ